MDIPEKEQRKLIAASLKCIPNSVEEARILQPLVISILPNKRPFKSPLGKKFILSIFVKIMLVIALFFIILIKSENKTTNPETDNVVDIALLIAFLKFSPKLLLFV